MLFKFKINYIACFLAITMFLNTLITVLISPRVMAEADDNTSFPIIMYHHISEDKTKVGDYVITNEQLKADFNFLSEQGYKTLSLRDLYAINNGEKTLEPKSIMLTFDDGQESFYKYVYPLLKKYNFKAVFSVIGIYLEEYSKLEVRNIAYSHSTFEQINEMVSSGLVEIANHSYNMHDNSGAGRSGVTKMAGESIENYNKAINNDILMFNNMFYNNLGFFPTAFTYPFGRYSKETEDIIKKSGFKAAFTCYEKRNTPIFNNDWLFNLGRYNRPFGPDSKKFFNSILVF